MNSSLSGKISFPNNLTGKSKNVISGIPLEIKQLKIRIFNIYILPLLSKKWKTVKENLFLLDQFKNKVDFYYQCYKNDDILVYKDLLNIFDVFVQQQVQLEDMEQKVYGNGQKDQVASMVYRTTMIKLKPEYELYDNILGKPKREKKEVYRQDIIDDITKYMILENINYQKIYEYITKKYNIE
jgi:hypothetical protein